MRLRQETSNTYCIGQSSDGIALASDVTVHESGVLEYKTPTGNHGYISHDEWVKVVQKPDEAVNDMYADGALTEAARREYRASGGP